MFNTYSIGLNINIDKNDVSYIYETKFFLQYKKRGIHEKNESNVQNVKKGQ